MTDELEGAPETIWAWPMSEGGYGNWTEGTNDFLEMERKQEMGTTAYTRKDIAVAAVEVAIEALTKREERITEIEEAIGAALDDIPTTDGFCDWADVANARDQILNRIKHLPPNRAKNE